MLLYDVKGNPLILFADRWTLRATLERDTELQYFEAAP